jgi:chromosome segregation ATPase
MFKHFESCGFVPLRPGPCQHCNCAMQMQIRTRNDEGTLNVAYYCPVCILRDVDTLKRERDEARVTMHEYRHTVTQMMEKLTRVTRERDEARIAFNKSDTRRAIAEREHDEWKHAYETADQAVTRSVVEYDKLKAERDKAMHALAQFQESASGKTDRINELQRECEARPADVEHQKHVIRELRQSHASCQVDRRCLQVTCDELCKTRDAMAMQRNANEREIDRLKVLCRTHEGTARDAQNERDRAQSRANCAEEELKQAQRKRDDWKKTADHYSDLANSLRLQLNDKSNTEHGQGFKEGRAAVFEQLSEYIERASGKVKP